jgi:hypothetical protein
MTLLSGGFEAMSQSYPWCCVGKVFVGTNPNFETSSARGTGVLVGRNLMMTASHLVPWKVPDGGFWWMSFAPGFRDGPVNGRSFVTRVRGIASGVDDNEPTGFDYVICRLSEPLGDKLGWMGSQSFGNESDYTNNRWISSGYPGWFEKGQRPTVEFDIDIDDIDNDDPGLELEITDGQAAGPGWSGGPLWGLIGNKPKVIGIKSGAEFDLYDPFREVFAGGPHLVDLIKHGQANW